MPSSLATIKGMKVRDTKSGTAIRIAWSFGLLFFRSFRDQASRLRAGVETVEKPSNHKSWSHNSFIFRGSYPTKIPKSDFFDSLVRRGLGQQDTGLMHNANPLPIFAYV